MHKEEFPCCQKSSAVSDSGIISYWLLRKKQAFITLPLVLLVLLG